MSPRYYRDRLVRFWWLLLLCGVCSGLGGWIGGVAFFTVYSSTTLIQVDVRNPMPTASTMLLVDRLTRTGAQLAVSDGILSQVARANNMSLKKLHSEVTAVPVANTQILSITVRDASSVRAASLANAIAQAVVTQQNHAIEQANTQAQQTYLATLNTLANNLTTLKAKLAALGQPPSDSSQALSLQIEIDATQGQYDLTQFTLGRIRAIQASETSTLRVASPAKPSSTPVISHQVVTALAGVGFGLAFGIFLVIEGEQLNLPVDEPDRVAVAFQWVRLGITPTAANGGDAEFRSSASHSSLADALLRDIQFLEAERSLRVVALVSAKPSVRTRDTAARLAIAFAHGGRNTLLVDAHLRAGAQDAIFDVPSAPGLSDLVLKYRDGKPTTQEIMEYLRPPVHHADPYLLILSSGSKPPNPARVLASKSCKQAIVALASLPAEVVLLDAPDALLSGDVDLLRSALDGVVVLIDPLTTRRGDLTRLARALAKLEAPVLGFVYEENDSVGKGSAAPASSHKSEAQLLRR
jgi:Mrp family chromosome partitioning ATPase